ncbi:MAG: hypothetical protein JO011_08375 [Ktedonobacteraceae bacterium]|nr:hypothetical protein [Ktedonobacteraceae bacterium]MBV9710913.1 hypothetical protein [Ktedonobacteraceae bacterium]
MSVDLLNAILSYATIPIYVVGLLVLVYCIARFQLGFSLSGQIKHSVKTKVTQQRLERPISAYLIIVLLFALFTFLTITNQRRRHV